MTRTKSQSECKRRRNARLYSRENNSSISSSALLQRQVQQRSVEQEDADADDDVADLFRVNIIYKNPDERLSSPASDERATKRVKREYGDLGHSEGASTGLPAGEFIRTRPWQNLDQHILGPQERVQIKQEEEEEEADENLNLPRRNFIILYGYTWGDRIVNTPLVQEILKRCSPISIDLSTEVSEHEKHHLRINYGIATDFVKLELDSEEEKFAAVEALKKIRLPSCCPGSSLQICEYPGFSILTQAHEMIKLEGSRISNSSRHLTEVRDHPQNRNDSRTTRSKSMSISTTLPSLVPEEYDNIPSPPRKEPTKHPDPTPQPQSQRIQENPIQDRTQYLPFWLNLANAVREARTKLQGEDLLVFEALIARPTGQGEDPDPMRVLGEWVGRRAED